MRSRNLLLIACSILVFSQMASAEEKKVLVIDSYNEGYAWSDGVINAAAGVLNGKAQAKIVRMDTKHNVTEEAKKAAAEKVKAEIDAWKPDVVIACDDNAVKYVIAPFYKNATLPVVFCGINWDASEYGLPCNNVTGILEVWLVPQLFANLEKFAKGKRIAFLGVDNETDRKEGQFVKKTCAEMSETYVKTFDEWKTAYKDLQDKADVLLWTNFSGIKDWNADEAKAFVLANTKIPTGSAHDFMAPFVLFTFAKLGAEQGQWAANTALEILGGKSPKDIPVASNKQGQLYVNIPLVKKLGIMVPMDLLKAAKLIKN